VNLNLKLLKFCLFLLFIFFLFSCSSDNDSELEAKLIIANAELTAVAIVQEAEEAKILIEPIDTVSEDKNKLFEICMADETELESGFFSGKSEQRIFCNCYVDLALSKWSLDEIIELDEMSNPPKEVFEFVDETWVCFAKKTVN
tara:strand:- start:130 stop:561 length:432 start_codon:yes stop_codon:yes gene_type:complete